MLMAWIFERCHAASRLRTWLRRVLAVIVMGFTDSVNMNACARVVPLFSIEERQQAAKTVTNTILNDIPLGEDVEKGRQQQHVGDEQDQKQDNRAGDTNDIEQFGESQDIHAAEQEHNPADAK